MTDPAEPIDGGDDPVAVVRRDMLTPIEGDYGIFRARLPWDLVLLLAGAPFAGSPPFEAELSRDHFIELGVRVVAFQKGFEWRRRRARRGRKQYDPRDAVLKRRFADDWKLVWELWPAVRWLGPVREIMRNAQLDEALLERLRPWKEEALLFLFTRAPHELEYAAVRRELQHAAHRLAGGQRRKLYPTEVESLADKAMAPGQALERALTYTPSGNAELAYDHWIGCARNRVRDLASQPVILGHRADGEEIRRARGTLRRLKWEGRIEVNENGELKKPLVEVVLEAEAALRHRDLTGSTLNAAEVAKLLGRSPRSVIAAIYKAIEDHAMSPKTPRLRGGPGYALTRAHVSIIKRYLGPKRGPKGKRTIRVVARELGVEPAKVVMVIDVHLQWLKRQGRNAVAAEIVKRMAKWMDSGEEREFTIVSRDLERVVRRRLGM